VLWRTVAANCYDFGRSVFFGTPDEEYRRCYDLVMGAQAAGIAALKVGATCAQADAAARDVISGAAMARPFVTGSATLSAWMSTKRPS